MKKQYKIAFTNADEKTKKLHRTGSAYYAYWKAENTDIIAEKALKKLQDMIKGQRYNFAAIMTQKETRGFKIWEEIGIIDEKGWRNDISFNSNNI